VKIVEIVEFIGSKWAEMKHGAKTDWIQGNIVEMDD